MRAPFIAVIDDDKNCGKALCELIETFGWITHSFDSAEAFLDEPLGQRPACVITDLRMPGLSGTALQQRLAQTDPDVPVIIISSDADEGTRARAVQQGAVRFLSKPVTANHITTQLSEFFPAFAH